MAESREKTIPFVSEYNTRGLFATASKDSRLINGVYVPVTDRAKNSATWYVEKRPGWVTFETESISGFSSGTGQAVFGENTGFVVSAFNSGSSTTTIFHATVNCGTLTGLDVTFNEFTWGNKTYVMVGLAGTGVLGVSGWYLGEEASTKSLTFSGNIVSGAKTISGVAAASQSGIYVGQLLTHTALTAGTRIASISGTDVITDTNAISTTAAATITKQPLSRIIDADFPNATGASRFAEMNGYVFVINIPNRRIYNSDLNAVHSWGASNYVTVNSAVGDLHTIHRYGDYIVAFCSTGIEFFFFAGNTSGSPLSSRLAIVGVGLASSFYSSVSAYGNVYWYFNPEPNRTGGGIYCFDGLTPKKISTPVIDNILAPNNTLRVEKLVMGGQNFISVHDVATVQYLYHIQSGKWTEGGFAAHYAVNGAYGIKASLGEGIVYDIDNGSFQDGSTTYTMEIQTDRMTFGSNNNKRIKSIELIADNQASGVAFLETTTDDYATFSTPREFDLTSDKKRLYNFGMGRSWAFRLKHYNNTAFRGEGLKIEYDEMDH